MVLTSRHLRFMEMGVASPGQLVEAMADALGLPPATVTQYDRVLAEAGLRSKRGRGTSAAKVTARDAAHLLIAILGAPIEGGSVNQAVHICQTYGSMPLLPRFGYSLQAFRSFGLSQLKNLPTNHTLADLVEALIGGIAQGHQFKEPGRRRKSPFDDEQLRSGDDQFRITLQGPRPWASIRLTHDIAEDWMEKMVARDRPSPPPELIYFDAASRQHPKRRIDGPDMFQERTVSFRTIRALGSLLAN